MQFVTLASLLVPTAVAWPRAMGQGDPLPQKSRFTAFLVNKEGEPSVECWEISHMVDNQQMHRVGSSDAAAYSLPLATPKMLEEIDVLTWPSGQLIWPPPNDRAQAEFMDLGGTYNLATVQMGLIELDMGQPARHETSDDMSMPHIFSMENGDDWFYFEDQSSMSQNDGGDSHPFTMRTVSGSKTELLRLKYNSQPKHRVVHKGACDFTGIETPNEHKSSRGQSPFTVQVNVEKSI